ncbi:MAG: ATP-binding protein [Acidimicrobiales bacterium]
MHEHLVFELRLPARPASVAVARALVRSSAALTTADAVLVELAVSELVTNSVRHASADTSDVVELQLTVDDERIVGVVRDHGPPFGVLQGQPDVDNTGGFGLYIVRQIAELRVEREGAGNAVTFVVGRSGPGNGPRAHGAAGDAGCACHSSAGTGSGGGGPT